MPSTEVPKQVRLVGVLVALEGLAGVAFLVALVVRALSVRAGAGDVLGEAGYFGLIGAGVIAVAAGLLLGKRWAFAPAAVIQVLLLGVAWYAVVGASRFDIGIPVGVLSLGLLVLLFTPASRAWRLGAEPGDGDDGDEPGGR